MKTWWNKVWCSLNYRYCMSSAYLLSKQGNGLIASADFMSRASEWQREYLMAGRKMV